LRILIVDRGAYALDWALRCVADGHKVKWFRKNDERTWNIGRGMVDIVDDWRDWARWADLIFLPDNTLYLYEVDNWRRTFGTPVIGPTLASAALELDRDAGMKLLKRHGVAVPPFRTFTRYDDAIAFVKREGRRFVSKPCGDEPDKSLSYVSKSAADMVYMLERWKKAQRHKGAFIMQEFVGGTEMAVGGWFGPGGFQDGWCENWEFKKLMPGDLGVATGEQGTVLRQVDSSLLADKVLAPLEEGLHRLGHTGYVDVNCIIDDEGTPWPLEWTMRPGWPLFNIQQALIEGDHAEWLGALADGSASKPWLKNKPAVGVVLSIPDYPYSKFTRKSVTGIPIYGLTSRNLPHIHPCEIMLGEAPMDVDGKVVHGPCWVTAGDYVLVASGVGDSVTSARNKVYRTLKQIEIPNSPMYRTDIGNRLSKQLPLIQPQGYAEGLTF